MKNRSPDRFDLDELLHPAQAFDHPAEVVNDPDLTLKRESPNPCLLGFGCLRRGSCTGTSFRAPRRPGTFRRHHGRAEDARQAGRLCGR
jgi:hypothetical protein